MDANEKARNIDEGHRLLIQDLEDLQNSVESFDYHDMYSTVHMTPKVALVNELNALIQRVKNGKYDN